MEKKDPIVLLGRGVHSGVPSRLEISVRDSGSIRDNRGPRFHFPGTGWVSFSDLADMPRRAERATRLGNSGAEIRTPEHLLAALLFFADAPLDLVCNAAELPIMDGSALPFRQALADLYPYNLPIPQWKLYPCPITWEHQWNSGYLRITPSDRFRVRYLFNRSLLQQTFVLENAATAWQEILPARTFAFYTEWRKASDLGLMAGVEMNSGILLAESDAEHERLVLSHPDWLGGPSPLLNQPAWRTENELAKHKILDLLGDLALNQLSLPAAEIEICNGGHHTNHLLLDKLTANPG